MASPIEVFNKVTELSSLEPSRDTIRIQNTGNTIIYIVKQDIPNMSKIPSKDNYDYRLLPTTKHYAGESIEIKTIAEFDAISLEKESIKKDKSTEKSIGLVAISKTFLITPYQFLDNEQSRNSLVFI